METGDEVMNGIMKRNVLDLRDTEYSGASSVIQTFLNYFFSFTWILMSLIVAVIFVAWIIVLFLS